MFCCNYSGLVIRTSALTGIPFIEAVLSSFVVIVNLVTSVIGPYLVCYSVTNMLSILKLFTCSIAKMLLTTCSIPVKMRL